MPIQRVKTSKPDPINAVKSDNSNPLSSLSAGIIAPCQLVEFKMILTQILK